ncbi:hypothetical protein [Tenacibaculum maritimum]|uniref:hypothetical protein n=1 Tax=Tenacibaculum maritimum TaxID=107401 RepID=UPI001330F147|nr:hypothetical protein [Tenacibaculum maritimum]
MKQIGQISNSTATKKDNEMLSDYWKVKSKNDIEGFVFSDNEFLKRYSSNKSFSNLKSIETFAVYRVSKCDVCLEPFNVIINDRNHLREFLQSKIKCCRVCKIYQSSIKTITK